MSYHNPIQQSKNPRQIFSKDKNQLASSFQQDTHWLLTSLLTTDTYNESFKTRPLRIY